MGCDIHAYIDYGERSVECFGQIDICRNYLLFGYLADVRGGPAVIEPKGLPDAVSWRVKYDAILMVMDDVNLPPGSYHCCTRADADGWDGEEWRRNNPGAVYGYVDESKTQVWHPDWHTHSWLTVDELERVVEKYTETKEEVVKYIEKLEPIPDGFHLHPQCLEDLSRLRHKMIVSDEPINKVPPPEIVAAIAAMKALNEAGNASRFIFWFDN